MATTPKPTGADSDEQLRRDARHLLDHGASPKIRSGTLGVDALQLLYQRASEPESAADALKLLHELQTFQVELDLMYQQLQANEHDLTEELAHYRSLYDQAPVAYLVVDSLGGIIESNRAAVALLGQSPEPGTSLNRLLQTELPLPLAGAAADGAGIGEQPVTLTDGRLCHARFQPAANGADTLLVLTRVVDPRTTPVA